MDPRPQKPGTPMAHLIDKLTLDKAANGESAALATLVMSRDAYVEKQLQRYPVTDEDRRDLLQTTLMRVVQRVGSFRGDSSFSTWLFRVTANEALMMMRSQRRHRARLVEGLDLDELGSLPAANDLVDEQRADASAAGRERDSQMPRALSERPHSLDELARLARLAHRLHEVRQGSKLAPNEPNDELVVAGIEAMASEPNVVGKLLRSVGHANLRVLAEDLRLLVRLETSERPASTERIPDVPAVVLFRYVLDRAPQKG